MRGLTRLLTVRVMSADERAVRELSFAKILSQRRDDGPAACEPGRAVSLVLALLGALRASPRTRTDLALENLALRQQLVLLACASPEFFRARTIDVSAGGEDARAVMIRDFLLAPRRLPLPSRPCAREPSGPAAAGRVCPKRSACPHRCRRSAVLDLPLAALVAMDIYSVCKLLGHSDVRITQKVYAPLSGKFLASEASKLGLYLAPSLIREISSHAERQSSSK